MSSVEGGEMAGATDNHAVILEVRQEREDLARVLKKHAGIRKIVEELYPDSAHFIYELLQNAEDARATEASFRLADDQLIFEHNGRAFSKDDILGITDIGEGTKDQDDDKIGRFGVGFKAVFAYSETPSIWSPTYCFKIEDLVLPSPIARLEGLESLTRFQFPFNNPKKPQSEAYEEIEKGLRELSETALLFLSHLQSIGWSIDGDGRGAVLRFQHTEHHIEVLKETDGAKTASAHFLKFEEAVPELPRQRVAVAYPLEFLPEKQAFDQNLPLAKQLKIAPASAGQVAVFFPAKSEKSGLRFHVHAPFVPEVSRASIKETPANEPLFEQLGRVAAGSLHKIRDMGLLNTDFLGVLPNHQDDLKQQYFGIRDALIAEFDNEPLMPTYSKGHAPAKSLYQAKKALKDLLSTEDLTFLVSSDNSPIEWAANRALQGTNVERFMNTLAITDWDMEEFLELLVDKTSTGWGEPQADLQNWLSSKTVEWHRQLYALLYTEPDTRDELYQLEDCRFVLLKDGSLGIASKSYFPDEKGQYLNTLPCVHAGMFNEENIKTEQNAKRFLSEVGVKNIGERQIVELLLERSYADTSRPIKEKEYVSHLRRFIKLLEEEPNSHTLLSSYPIFVGEDGSWHKAGDLFLDVPFLPTGLRDYYRLVGGGGLTPLADFYLELPIDTPKVARFAEALGAKRYLTISPASCRNNPQWDFLRSVPGERYTNAQDSDFKLKHFEKMIAAKSVNISYLIWQTMIAETKTSSYTDILKASYRKNWSGGTRYRDSQLVYQLRSGAWVPQGERIVKPAEARAELLPEGFTFDQGWDWIKAIEFGKDVDLQNARAQAQATAAVEKEQKRKAAAEELGFSSDALGWLDKLAEVPAEQRDKLISEWERIRAAAELPEHEPRNPERRAERTGEFARSAPERQTEQRTRSVSIGRDAVKAEAHKYLIQEYQKEGEVFCQLCKTPMPFKLDNGDPYLELVEFFPGLTKHYHQNYLALCPNHSAMFKYANSSSDIILDMFKEMVGNYLEVVVGQRNETIYFTGVHIADLRKVIEVDQEDVAGVEERERAAS